MKSLPVMIACVAIAAGAAAHGAAIHRWETPTPVALDRLHAHAVTLGDYESESVPNDLPLKEKSVGTCRRYISRLLSHPRRWIGNAYTRPTGCCQ